MGLFVCVFYRPWYSLQSGLLGWSDFVGLGTVCMWIILGGLMGLYGFVYV